MPDAVPITGQTIKLGQFLKLANVVDQGSDVKLLLGEGRVTVNGQVEQRRGRQLVRGDVVAVDGLAFDVG
jgi:ribosome-associated protein